MLANWYNWSHSIGSVVHSPIWIVARAPGLQQSDMPCKTWPWRQMKVATADVGHIYLSSTVPSFGKTPTISCWTNIQTEDGPMKRRCGTTCDKIAKNVRKAHLNSWWKMYPVVLPRWNSKETIEIRCMWFLPNHNRILFRCSVFLLPSGYDCYSSPWFVDGPNRNRWFSQRTKPPFIMDFP